MPHVYKGLRGSKKVFKKTFNGFVLKNLEAFQKSKKKKLYPAVFPVEILAKISALVIKLLYVRRAFFHGNDFAFGDHFNVQFDCSMFKFQFGLYSHEYNRFRIFAY